MRRRRRWRWTYRIIDGFKWRKVVFPVGEKEIQKNIKKEEKNREG